ncbi:class I SAM-dependent methyltransferase [Vitiosangium sp. GDMCC 1.1324]|uniref:class I SAM-dependent methyltransferase n=1 Tax=Vitiosangium sp. (strain GDMCC 1.1324) TaxID=2138576 RepID=UPI000D3B217F|nr:methyltransferase domain-containing protein [Vitiosangium sp. GDMCC 1.1324]PTL82229.1 hypothetical protein DAT35_20790 [Vitiosangium sp. GDMCC 1.1324]
MPTRLPSCPSPWDQVAVDYAAEVTPLFRHFSQEALQLAALTPGARVLDVATGPGTLALEAARLGARVSAVDSSPRMIDALRARAAAEGVDGIAASVGDGQALVFSDGVFDATFSMFGLIFFPDRAKGFRELRRVLRPGGRAVVSSWAAVERSSFMSVLWTSLRAAMPMFFWPGDASTLASPEGLRQEMRASSFREVDVRTTCLDVTFPSPNKAWAWFASLSPPLVGLRSSVGEGPWRAFSGRVSSNLEASLGQGEVRLELSAHLGLGWA